MSRSWTEAQNSAITVRNSNLLISAAAGSGKTAVLVERIIRLISDEGYSIDEMLIVTFTKAAAGEMKERIMLGISQRLSGENIDYKLAARLRGELVRLAGANISTIHSFCNEIVSSYFFRLGIDANAKVGEKSDIESLIKEALDHVFEKVYAKASFSGGGALEGRSNEEEILSEEVDFDQIVKTIDALSVGGKVDEEARDAVVEIYRFIMTKPEPEKWLTEKVLEYDRATEPSYKSMWEREIEGDIKFTLEYSLESYKNALDDIENYPALTKVIEFGKYELSMLESAAEDVSVLGNMKFERFPTIRNSSLEDSEAVAKDGFKAVRDKVKKQLETLGKNAVYIQKSMLAEHMEACGRDAKALRYLVLSFAKKFKELKTEGGLLDYTDLEHYMIELLSMEDVKESLKSRFKHIFVDEYQDTNEVQEYIVNSISSGNNVFMVGDIKQSIYRFRLADPDIFTEKYERFKEAANNKPEGVNRVIDLSMNFRSRPELLENVNSVFENVMSPRVGGTVYDHAARLHPSTKEFSEDESAGEFRLGLIERGLNESKGGSSEELEALAAGRKIKELVGSGKYRYSDIAVLARSVKKYNDGFTKVFKEMGIPLFSEMGESAFDTLEIKLMINTLKVIDNANYDIPLLSLMHSPIGGFSVNEMMELALFRGRGGKSYIDILQRLVEEFKKDEEMSGLDDEFKERFVQFNISDLMGKIIAFMDNLNRWKQMAEYLPIDTLLTEITESTGYVHYISSMEGGVQRTANLRLLIERAAHYEKGQTIGLTSFISYIEKLKKNKMDLDVAKIVGEADNVVRLMTIHKSKGLEFKVVIMVGAGSRFNTSESRKTYVLHKELGLGLDYINTDEGYKMPSASSIAVKLRNKRESLSEEMRVLYVALTRGIDRIYVYGSVASNSTGEKYTEKWENADGEFIANGGNTFGDWIGAGLYLGKKREYVDIIEGDELVRESLEVSSASEGIGESLSDDGYGAEDVSDELKREIERRLNFPYGNYHGGERGLIPEKISVSALIRGRKAGFDNSMGTVVVPEIVEKPGFMREASEKGKLSAAEMGNEIHKALQLIKLSEDLDEKGIDLQIEEMAIREIIINEKSAVDRVKNAVTSFFMSDIGRRMLGSSSVHRERPFIYKKEIEGQSVMVQGIIDCYFKEKDSYVIIDYKSGGMGFKTKDEALEEYRFQLEEYKEALEALTGKEVEEIYLCFPEKKWYIKV